MLLFCNAAEKTQKRSVQLFIFLLFFTLMLDSTTLLCVPVLTNRHLFICFVQNLEKKDVENA